MNDEQNNQQNDEPDSPPVPESPSVTSQPEDMPEGTAENDQTEVDTGEEGDPDLDPSDGQSVTEDEAYSEIESDPEAS